ncbi:MAG: thioredoxin family protein [Candidatus Taylorbacteria bacterium]|nr:thioredoxin family protein [Candidatus Taylorbacteria bacterium]
MLLFFYGEECSHCHKMLPLVAKLEEETGAKIEKYEVWHNEENKNKLEEYDKGLCGGVPFFFNTETKAHICGAVDYDVLQKWAGN